MSRDAPSPTGGVTSYTQVPSKVHRRTLVRQVYKRRSCRDGRAYDTVHFTCRDVLEAKIYDVSFKADRDYWVARVTADVGRHDPDTHPNDGTPSGHDLTANLHVVDVNDDSNDQMILVSNSRLRIVENHHTDAVNDEEDGPFSTDDFNIHRLAEGDQVYPEILAIGSGRPGTTLVIALILVPIP